MTVAVVLLWAALGLSSTDDPAGDVPAEVQPAPAPDATPAPVPIEPRADATEPTPAPEPKVPLQVPTPPSSLDADSDDGDGDWGLLAVDYAILLVPLPGFVFLVPLFQGLAHKWMGGWIADQEYPKWWIGTLTGYAVIVGSTALSVAGFAALTTAVTSPDVRSDRGLFTGLMVGGAVAAIAAPVLLLSEPLWVWLTAGIGKMPEGAGSPTAKSARFDGPLPTSLAPVSRVPDEDLHPITPPAR